MTPLSFPEPNSKPIQLLVRYGWRVSILGSLVLHGLAVGLLAWMVHAREESVILRYNVYLGIDLLGVWWQLFLVPAVTFLFVAFNTILALLLRRRGYTELAVILLLGNWLLSLAVVVVAGALSFINV